MEALRDPKKILVKDAGTLSAAEAAAWIGCTAPTPNTSVPITRRDLEESN